MLPISSFSPPLTHFLGRLGEERHWGQVRIRREGACFELRHREDAGVAGAELKPVPVSGLRELGDRTSDGLFRPLKSVPNLVRGWRCRVETAAELERAIQALYPGSLADAWGWETGAAKADSFEAVAARQAGRGRILQGLKGSALAAAVEGGCGPGRCLKRRRWTAEGLGEEAGEGKGDLPCLEPCGVFLAFSQACARAEQASSVPVHFAPDDLATLAAALRHVLDHPADGLREGDLSAPLQPRRVARLLARHREVWDRAASGSSDADAHE